jgi:histone H3/H4
MLFNVFIIISNKLVKYCKHSLKQNTVKEKDVQMSTGSVSPNPYHFLYFLWENYV